MSLSKHVDPDRVIAESREHSKKTGRTSIHDLMGREHPGHMGRNLKNQDRDDGTEPIVSLHLARDEVGVTKDGN